MPKQEIPQSGLVWEQGPGVQGSPGLLSLLCRGACPSHTAPAGVKVAQKGLIHLPLGGD